MDAPCVKTTKIVDQIYMYINSSISGETTKSVLSAVGQCMMLHVHRNHKAYYGRGEGGKGV